MVKVEQTLHDFYFLQVVGNAKTIAEKIKNLFRVLEANAFHPEENPSPETEEDTRQMVCACCAKNVLPPCWVCVMCGMTSFFKLVSRS
jgi:hypothetical protein